MNGSPECFSATASLIALSKNLSASACRFTSSKPRPNNSKNLICPPISPEAIVESKAPPSACSVDLLIFTPLPVVCSARWPSNGGDKNPREDNEDSPTTSLQWLLHGTCTLEERATVGRPRIRLQFLFTHFRGRGWGISEESQAVCDGRRRNLPDHC